MKKGQTRGAAKMGLFLGVPGDSPGGPKIGLPRTNVKHTRVCDQVFKNWLTSDTSCSEVSAHLGVRHVECPKGIRDVMGWCLEGIRNSAGLWWIVSMTAGRQSNTRARSVTRTLCVEWDEVAELSNFIETSQGLRCLASRCDVEKICLQEPGKVTATKFQSYWCVWWITFRCRQQ